MLVVCLDRLRPGLLPKFFERERFWIRSVALHFDVDQHFDVRLTLAREFVCEGPQFLRTFGHRCRFLLRLVHLGRHLIQSLECSFLFIGLRLELPREDFLDVRVGFLFSKHPGSPFVILILIPLLDSECHYHVAIATRAQEFAPIQQYI